MFLECFHHHIRMLNHSLNGTMNITRAYGIQNLFMQVINDLSFNLLICQLQLRMIIETIRGIFQI